MNETPREEQLRQQVSEIAGLAGGLAHEVRNPLSTIRLNLELLFEDVNQLEGPIGQRIARKLKTVQGECQHLEEILEAFLEFARAGELSTQEHELNQVLSSILEFWQPEADRQGIEIRPHLPSDLPAVQIDRRLLRQAIVNLIKNAQQAMPDGGMIELQTYQKENRVYLEIIDTGCGMSAESCEKMFQVFFSTKADGNGLGLPTARKIIEAHHGTIHCESELGRGTKFTITLPVPGAPQ